MILRPATQDDVPAIARVMRAAFRVSLPFLPEIHTEAEDLGFVATRMLPQKTVWVATVADTVVGFIAFDEAWINQLYLHPDHQGQGIGPVLLDKALESGTPKQLWAFQQNERARRFYEARGFVATEFTDGADNEEKTPDVRYVWSSQAL